MRRYTLIGGLMVAAALAVPVSYATWEASQETARASDASEVPLRPITPTETDRLYTAEQLLVKECMRRAGFLYNPSPRNPVPEHRNFPYVVDDITWARRHGYGSDLEEKRDRLAKNSANRRYFESLSPAQKSAVTVAMNGPTAKGLRAYLPNGQPVEHSDKGCTSEARRKLYRDLPAWYRTLKLTESLPGFRAELVLNDRAYLKAVTKWSRCMRTNGFQYPTPAHSRAAGMAGEPVASRAFEIRLAVTEAQCAAETGLARTAKALDRHHDGVLRRKFHRELAAHQKLQIAALSRAGAIVEPG
ncbi:hypothetical protein [Actinomadura livida]|uniref:Secreted protein n=1 Tax=Actinomadura livida TaxID=79909 RepID=A0A7W7IFE6_9ACTN|nr:MULTISPECIES: hypothetical protein [Actinomadura]MBB4775979.1 hypothetical protein [Actinomadura catellatispora]GGU16368.1 hypothetical protein GCM10010208_46870 [Actinomadura livida]